MAASATATATALYHQFSHSLHATTTETDPETLCPRGILVNDASTTAFASIAAMVAGYMVNPSDSKEEASQMFVGMVSKYMECSDKLNMLSKQRKDCENHMQALAKVEPWRHSLSRDQAQHIQAYQCMIETQQAMICEMEVLLGTLGMNTRCVQKTASSVTLSDRETSPLPTDGWNDMQGHSSEEKITKIRWNISQFVGGGVGTGRIVEKKKGRDGLCVMVIRGSGVTTELRLLPKGIDLNLQERAIVHHQYLFELTPHDRRTLFVLKSSKEWVQDSHIGSCEFRLDPCLGAPEKTECTVQFGLFHRRHHCRRCGHIFCNTHSSNALPLFEAGCDTPEWARVCDVCFHELAGPHLRQFRSVS